MDSYSLCSTIHREDKSYYNSTSIYPECSFRDLLMAKRFFPIYNIDTPVGPGKPNRVDDVRLVQNLLIELSRFAVTDWVVNIPSERRNLASSGRFDDLLEFWIKAYQNWLVKGFGGTAVFKSDGIIDPLPIHNIVADTNFASGRIATLAMLCNQLWRYDHNIYLRIGEQDKLPWIPEKFVN